MNQYHKPFSCQKLTVSVISYLFTIIVTLFFHDCFAQFQDDFSDNDFLVNPAWHGDTSKFRINADYQLQLDDEGEGIASLTTENHDVVGTEWQFWIKCSFSPSANNNARVYLISNEDDLNIPLNGYYVQLGESGSDDAIELFRQQGEEVFSICRGSEGLIASSFAIRVKVIRKLDYHWEILVDPSGGVNFQTDAHGLDSTITFSNASGIRCKYTSSNSTKMYFDDFYAGPIIIDTVPPEIELFVITSETSADVKFNEVVETISAEILSNYLIKPGSYFPVMAFHDENYPENVYLNFDRAFKNGETYTLVVNGVDDLEGNTTMFREATFLYFEPRPFDVVINEIMADPVPVVALPPYEFIELANNTDFPINLSGWTLTIGTSIKTFGDVVIQPTDYLIISKENTAPEFSILGDFYGFSSFSLNNTSQSLILRNNRGKLMSAVNYDNNWYKDGDKAEGGYSLEQIDQENSCQGGCNWQASMNILGGTPGTKNSVYQNKNILPEMEGIAYINPYTFELWFSQIMDSVSLTNIAAYEIDQGIGNPDHVAVVGEDFKNIRLTFSNEIYKEIIYKLSISDTIMNCSGLPLLPGDEVLLGIPVPAAENDLVINEVLFNPLGGGEDYVEIYNRSDRIIDLSGIHIGSIRDNPPNPPDTTLKRITNQCQLIFPEEYYVLTANQETVKDQYYTSNPGGFITMNSFPSLPSDNGTVLILSDLEIIDRFPYNENMHYPLLNYLDGVSLERINYDNSSLQDNNWHSASETVGFGTPAYKNSQFVGEIIIQDPFEIRPEIFSPDGDGSDDLLNIHYCFDRPGNNVSITIFDAGGRLIKNLVKNELTGADGFFSWDGLNENHQRALIGIYVIFIEVFTADGQVGRYKKTGVLGGNLR